MTNPDAVAVVGRYDLSSFMDRHPGGPEALALGRGRDCTVLFETYHSLANEAHVR